MIILVLILPSTLASIKINQLFGGIVLLRGFSQSMKTQNDCSSVLVYTSNRIFLLFVTCLNVLYSVATKFKKWSWFRDRQYSTVQL